MQIRICIKIRGLLNYKRGFRCTSLHGDTSEEDKLVRRASKASVLKRRKRRSYEFWRQRRNVIKKSGNKRENGGGEGTRRRRRRGETRSALAKGIGTGPAEIATNDCV